MDETTKKILEIVTDIQDRMATKVDLESVRKDLQAQISENTRAIAEMAEQLRGVFGYAKEIDALMTRMAAVEKHVGIAK
ncbi:MAG: hypothetical protein Q8R25_03835 [bacterium]|nr:hypothetical protein [bacterium]